MRKRENRNIRITVDPRKIKTGYKHTEIKDGKEISYPKKLDYFMLQHPQTNEVIFPELIAAYGNKPQELFILFPSGNLEDVFNDDFNLWNKSNTKTRQCDSETCLHVIDETIEGIKYTAGTTTECVCKHHNLFDTEDKDLSKLKCKCDMYLKAYILHPETNKVIYPMPYLFSCHSVNSADNIYSMLSRIKDLSNIPFKISIKLIKKNNMSFPIWNIIPNIMTENLIDWKPELLEESSTDPEIENADKETGEVKEDFTHLYKFIERIIAATTLVDLGNIFREVCKGLKDNEIKYLREYAIKQKEFINEAAAKQ